MWGRGHSSRRPMYPGLRKLYGHLRDQPLRAALFEQQVHGLSSSLAVLQGQLVDIHPDEPVRLRLIEAAAELHRIGDGFGPVLERVGDRVVQHA